MSRSRRIATLLAPLLGLLLAGCNDNPKLMADSSVGAMPSGRHQVASAGQTEAVGGGSVGTAGGKARCAPGKWVASGRWWCTLCNEDGTDFANGGKSVDDSNICTVDRCDPDKGVVHDPGEGLCPNQDICHKGSCRAGQCAQDPISCEDSNPCTQDSCAPATGCTYTPTTAACDDGIALTPDDTCVEGICVGILDADRDGIPNHGPIKHCSDGQTTGCVDNCPMTPNPDQKDSDGNGLGDACGHSIQVMNFKTKAKVIALTFDDGYNDQATMELLDTLKAFNARATFFINGLYLDNGALKSATISRLIHDGHKLGNHSFSHTIGTKKADTVLELTRGDEALEAMNGHDMRPYFRSPAFSDAPWLAAALNQAGYSHDFRANMDPKDWRETHASTEAMLKCLTERVEPGDIVLMHAGPRFTADTLPRVMAMLKEQGYTFLTVEDMIYFGTIVERGELLAKTCERYYGNKE
jgi:peptidoglycan/xylan/chitin deacetylase (PgdA/CDA1 family)